MGASRRAFIHMASVLFPSLLFNPFSIFRSLFTPEGKLRPLKRPRPNPFVRDGRALVGVVRGKDVGRMIRECVDLIGGIEKLNIRGKTVLVKPNVVSGEPPPTTTNPEVVKHTIRLLYEAGAKKVVVGDMSSLVALPTKKNLEKTGIEKVAREAGAEVIDFDDVDWIEVKPPEVRLVRSIHVALPVYEAEFFVNLPVVKTHRNASYSICLKNMVGVTHPRYRPYRVNPLKWEEVVAEMNLCVHPDLNIVDATTIMVAGGPWSGTAEQTDMILASGDRIAADVVGLGLIKSFGKWDDVAKIGVWEQRQIRHAQWLGLGVQEKKSLEMATKLLEGQEGKFSRLITQIQGFIEA
ncbi:MAG: DUF362 domain-containing protein [Nitrospira sp.]|nr:DUF362 domain-containing protein [Nitrospira sp.]